MAAASLPLLLAAPMVAETDEASPPAEATGAAGPVVEVTALEYAFVGLPTSVPLGTTQTLTNEGAEIHELALARIGDDVTETIEELRAMEEEGRDPITEGLMEVIDTEPIIALPGATAEGSITLDREGRYVALCFIPVGLLPEQLEELVSSWAEPVRRLRGVQTPGPPVQPLEVLTDRRLADTELTGRCRDRAGPDVRPEHLELSPRRPLPRHQPAFR